MVKILTRPKWPGAALARKRNRKRLKEGKKKKLRRQLAHDMTFDHSELEASLCRDSFYDFVQRFWDVVIPEDAVWNWHIKLLCDTLQDAAERVFRGEPKAHDIVINVPPGTSKSTICSVMFPAWIWTRMPSCRSLCASYAQNLAMDLSRKSRDVVLSEKWKRLFGEVELREDQNAKSYYVNQHGGMRYAVGVNGTVTGFHGHFIIVDDPLDPRRAYSDADLKATNRWVTETLKMRKVDKAVSVTILIMQRLHQNDPSAVMLKKADEKGSPVKHIKLPSEIIGKKRGEVRPRRLAKFYDNGLLDPVRLSRTVLDEARVDLNEYGYASQMLQTPTPRGGGMFKVERLKLEPAHPPLRHFLSLVRFWDKAGSDGSGAYTVGALLGLDRENRYWILDIVRGQWESAERERIIKNTAESDVALCGGRKNFIIGIEQEPGSGGKDSALATARNLAGYRVRIVRPTGDKVIRADPLSVQVNVGNVSVLARPWTSAFLNEFQFFPFSTYKDQVDASSAAFNLITAPRVRIGAVFRRKKHD